VPLLIWTCDQQRPAVIVTAHRGATGTTPENTISAMLKAVEAGADFAELDVQETSDGIIILLHDFSAIDKVKKLNPDIRAGYIFSKMPEDIDVFTANVDLLSVKYKLVDKEFVGKAHANNKEVHVWTVNEPEEMKRLIGLGVNSIITNYPERLVEILKNSH
ncbi:MAG: glycerophosphodiester phosphodiesterase, partial [candidate division KSB1 bacterium]|nr:glycerophosphodiester phosphodiesterase [candidate division KSB1 bacterium]